MDHEEFGRFPAPKDDIPTEEIVDRVYVVNKEHKRYLDPGIIIDKAHIHYRIRFADGVNIWMPEHWVRRVPDDMRP